MNKLMLIGLIWGLVVSGSITAQDKSEGSYKPLKLSLSDDDSQYIRFIFWHQQWARTCNLNADTDLKYSNLVRLSRLLMYAQINPRLLILAHAGINNLTAANLGSTRSSEQSTLFLHDACLEFKFTDALFIGTGLHYFNGLTRIASASTLNFLRLDACSYALQPLAYHRNH